MMRNLFYATGKVVLKVNEPWWLIFWRHAVLAFGKLSVKSMPSSFVSHLLSSSYHPSLHRSLFPLWYYTKTDICQTKTFLNLRTLIWNWVCYSNLKKQEKFDLKGLASQIRLLTETSLCWGGGGLWWHTLREKHLMKFGLRLNRPTWWSKVVIE